MAGSKFWFIGGFSDYVTSQFKSRMHIAFKKEGLDSEEYCIIHPRLSQYEFFGLAKSADIILDGIAWSGNNSSLEAMAFNKPIVTIQGKYFRSRHSSAILKRINVVETIARNVGDYKAIAIRLGIDEGFRAKMGEAVARNKKIAYSDIDVIQGLEEFFKSVVAFNVGESKL